MKKICILMMATAFIYGCPQQQNQPQAQNPPPVKKPDNASQGPANYTYASQPADQNPPIKQDLSPIPPSTQPAGPQSARTYTVEKGDTFYSISRKLYGSDKRAKEIKALNPGVEPTKLKVGQAINVPQ